MVSALCIIPKGQIVYSHSCTYGKFVVVLTVYIYSHNFICIYIGFGGGVCIVKEMALNK